MAETMVLEGTGEQLAKHLLSYPKQRFRLEALTGIEDAEQAHMVTPNEAALTALREIAERQKGRPHMDGSDTLSLIHQARDGGMYDDNAR